MLLNDVNDSVCWVLILKKIEIISVQFSHVKWLETIVVHMHENRIQTKTNSLHLSQLLGFKTRHNWNWNLYVSFQLVKRWEKMKWKKWMKRFCHAFSIMHSWFMHMATFNSQLISNFCSNSFIKVLINEWRRPNYVSRWKSQSSVEQIKSFSQISDFIFLTILVYIGLSKSSGISLPFRWASASAV